MPSLHLLLAIHNHQPGGNFPEVFERAHEECYAPFLKALEAHPGVLVTLHYSGPLLEWLQENRPETLETLRALVRRGQVEIMGGGFYEPLLPTIPEADALGQIAMMRDYIRERFDWDPEGIWLTERVWDPGLPLLLHKAGARYTLLDETHFLYGGLDASQILDYYVTERLGSSLFVFPILKRLRYMIPFRPVEEVITTLHHFADAGPDRAITYGDDGEKFGLWPGTRDWVYRDGWLESFFSALEANADWLHLGHFSSFLREKPPRDRLYLPPASYEEMMEWALPAEASRRFHEFKERVGRWDESELYFPFLRGGQWENFLVKYPESNQIHKKMLYVSRRISEVSGGRRTAEALEEARRHLWKGQTNCAYWHGLFGGLYLNYLRHDLYSNLLAAESLLDRVRHRGRPWMESERLDFDQDGREEILLRNPDLNLYLDPARGGSLWELDYKPAHFNLANVLTRRREAYHSEIRRSASGEQQDLWKQPASIHEQAHAREAGLEELLLSDWYSRRSLLDHFFPPETRLPEFSRCDYREWGDFVNQPYTVGEIRRPAGGKTLSLELSRAGNLWIPGQVVPLQVGKTVEMENRRARFRILYRLSCERPSPPRFHFGSEFNLTLLAGDDPRRYFVLPGVARDDSRMGGSGETGDVEQFFLVDEWTGFALGIFFSRPCTLWRFPLETVSQGEAGYQKSYQGSVLLPWWEPDLETEREWHLEIELEIKSTEEWKRDRRFPRSVP